MIIRRARNGLGSFCRDECRAYCCRRGFLVLTEKQLPVVLGKSMHDVKKTKDGKYSHDQRRGCPSLSRDFTCSIHNSRLRPKVCREFPLFLHGNIVIASEACLGVRAGLLYPYLKRLQMLGYEIVYSSPFSDVICDKIFIKPMKVQEKHGPVV